MTAPVRSTQHVRWGFSDIWYAPAGTAEPASTATLTEPSTPWVGFGYTAEGAALSVTKETEEATVEEELLPIGEDVTSVGIQLVLSMAEDTLENRAMAYGIGSVTTTAAGVGQIGKKTLTFDTQLRKIAICLMATNGYGFKDRIYLPNVVATGDVETAYRRNPGDKRVLPVTFKVQGTLSAVPIIQQSAAAS